MCIFKPLLLPSYSTQLLNALILKHSYLQLWTFTESTKIISMISLDNFMISRNFKKSDVSLDIRLWTSEFRRCRGAEVQGRLPAAGRRATSAACRQCKQTHRRRRRRLSTGGVDAYLYIPYLSWNTNQQQPLLLRVRPIVNDLAAGETRVAVEHLLRLWVTCTNHRQTEWT